MGYLRAQNDHFAYSAIYEFPGNMMGQDEPGNLPAVRALESELLEIEARGCR
jgi:hypothetical protein